uniref:Uncharacterized protein n=1 Tax=Cacopsylla melanoneura TaxID=428564 RepID=A0A8D8V948_9HEMI
MSWLFSKLSGKSDNILVENQNHSPPEPESSYEVYPSLPTLPDQPTPRLPYNIQPTPTRPSNNYTSSSNVLPHTLDEMKVKFKFLYDSNMEDLEMNQILSLVNQTKQSSRNLDELISDIESVDFSLERSVISST